MKDTVLFISAYNSKVIKTSRLPKNLVHIFSQRNKSKTDSMLKKHHLLYVATDANIASVTEQINIETNFDYVQQVTKFNFKSKESNEIDNSQIKNVGFYMNLMHAKTVLLDDSYFKLNFTFGLESFLVWIDDCMYQIDSNAFMIDYILFIVFEVIDYKTGRTLSKDDVCGVSGNYNLLSINKYQFFNEQQPSVSKSKISNIIYERICSFLVESMGFQYEIRDYSYLHDTLVLSNNINNIEDYICKLINVKNSVSLITDISTIEMYEYYPQDGYGIVTKYNYDCFNAVLYPSIILEAIKLYIYITQISNLENEMDLHKIFRNNIYLQNLFYSPNLPIETYNLLNYIKESESYKKHAEALNLKISYLTTQNDLRRNRNATILNVLLYFISLLGAIGTLDTIENKLGIPFKYSFIVIVIILLTLGVICVIEYRNNKHL